MLLVILVVGSVGLPITLSREKTGRFPCENCPCGCVSADFCWNKCCCHSDVEKLRWARENGIQAPAFLIARVGQPDVSLASNTSPPRSCYGCSRVATAVVDETTSGSGAVKCDGLIASSTTATDAPTTLRWVLLEDAAKCRGIELIWSLLSSVVVGVRPVSHARAEPRFLGLLPLLDEFPNSSNPCPDPPVP